MSSPTVQAGSFPEAYRAMLAAYVLHDSGEQALMGAYELGRRALTEQYSLIDLMGLHQEAMIGALMAAEGQEAAARLSRGETFLAEVIAPFEMMHRGYVETIRQLKELNATLEQRVEERTRALLDSEHKIAGLARLYAILSGINSAIVRLREREELFCEACRIAVDQGRFTAAMVVERKDGTLRPVVWRTRDDAPPIELEAAQRLTAAIQGQAAQLDGTASLVQQLADSPAADGPLPLPAHAYALLPLRLAESTVAWFVLFADEAVTFDNDERRLLDELAGDLSFALTHMEKEAQLAYLAYYDALTGLPNSNLMLERMERQIRMGDSRFIAVMLLDLVRFSNINDTYGRHVGDQMLKQVASRLQKTTAAHDTVARMSADRFTLLFTRLDDAAQVAHRLESEVLNSFAQPFRVAENEVYLSAQVGISLYPTDAQNAETLYKNAEIALKRAQRDSERYLVYDPAMNDRIVRTVTMEARLRRALARDELMLHYQPKVATDTGAIVGLEALVRYADPEVGMIPPTQFVPMLEETGMIIDVGNWVLRRAAADVAEWTRQGLRPPRVAVNVSVIQMRNRLFVKSLGRVAGHDRAGLDIEITESAVMEEVERNIPKLTAARDMGFEIAIDDFGTGYSSLSYLSKLPVNALKIDRSFIIDMADSPSSLAIVNSIISLAHSLNLKVIAEGVELEEQAKLLRLLRCEQIQGHLYGKAMPADEVAGLLRRA